MRIKKVLILKTGQTESDKYLIDQLNIFGKSEVEYTVSYYNDIEIYLPNRGADQITATVGGKSLTTFDLVYFKSWRKKQPIAKALSEYIQYKGGKFIDKAVNIPVHGNKISQLMTLQIAELPTPSTIFIAELSQESWKKLVGLFGNKFIMKSAGGSRGSDNYLIESEIQFDEIRNNKEFSQKDFIFQEYIPNKYDYRLLVLGGEVKVAEKRIRVDESSHKNNSSLGAIEEFIDVNTVKHFHDMAVRSAALFKREVAGVDIVVSNIDQTPYILEVNPSPGFTYDVVASPEIMSLNEYLLSLVR